MPKHHPQFLSHEFRAAGAATMLSVIAAQHVDAEFPPESERKSVDEIPLPITALERLHHQRLNADAS